MGLLGTLEIARSGLLAHASAAAVTGHNIANAQSPNFSRQRPVLTSVPVSISGLDVLGVPGRGVVLAAVERVTDEFAIRRLRTATAQAGTSTGLKASLEHVEAVSISLDGGVNSDLSAFFDAFEQLADAPESGAMRVVALQAGMRLAESVSQQYQRMFELREQIDGWLPPMVDTVNQLAEKVAMLNADIAIGASSGPLNNLLDERDGAVVELARLIGAWAIAGDGEQLDVLIGGQRLVQGDRAFELIVEPDPSNAGLLTVKFASGTEAAVSGGEIAGLIAVRDQHLPAYLAEIESFRDTLAAEVNALHQAGIGLDGSTTGLDFFILGVDGEINVNPVVAADSAKIGASAGGEPGDGQQAQAIADLRDARVGAGGTATLTELYSAFVTRVGLDVSDAQELAQARDLVVARATEARHSAAGVSLDEELVNLVVHQRAFEASARLAGVIDGLLETVIGLVG